MEPRILESNKTHLSRPSTLRLVRPRPNSTLWFLKSKDTIRLSLEVVTTNEDASEWVRESLRLGLSRKSARAEQVTLGTRSEEATGKPGLNEPTLHLPQPSEASTRAACFQKGCRVREATTRKHLPGTDALGPRTQTPACQWRLGPAGTPVSWHSGARWRKGTQVARTLTWQYLLPRRRQQQSRQLLAPSSAATSFSAAATNHPSGTAKRLTPVSRCPLRPRTPSEGRDSGGEGRRSGPSALGRGPGNREPRPVRAEGPGRQGDPEAAPTVRQGRGHSSGWVCYCRLCPFLRGACRETAGGVGGGARPVAQEAHNDGAQVRKSMGCREWGQFNLQ